MAQVVGLPPRARAALVAEALRVADPTEAEALGLALLELAAVDTQDPSGGSTSLAAGLRRRCKSLISGLLPEREPVHRVALRELGRSIAILPADVRELAVASGRGRWSSVVGTQLTSQDAAARLEVARLAGLAGDPELADAASELLRDSEPAVRETAEAALLTLALAASDPDSAALADHLTPAQHAAAARVRSTWTEGDAARVRESLGEALAAMSLHRRENLLLAALLAIEPCVLRQVPSIARWLQDREQSGHSFLRGLMRRDTAPLSRLRAWQWAGRTAVSGASADRLVVAKSIDEHEAVLSQWHLARAPARVAALERRTPSTSTPKSGPRVLVALIPTPEQTERLSPDARCGIAAIASRLPAKERDAACEPLLADREPMVRLAATGGCSSRMLGDFCLDTNATVARSAYLRRSVAATEDASRAPGAERLEQERVLARVLLRSPHAEVRAMARQDLELLCEASTTNAASRVAVGRALRLDRPWVVTRLVELIRSSPKERSIAIQLARRLGLTGEIRPALIETVRVLLGTSELAVLAARDLATATSALADVPDTQAAQLLDQAAGSVDQRVRANAVDAMVQRVRSGVETQTAQVAERLMELKDDPWHRVRGSAVRGLEILTQVKLDAPVRTPQVGEQLLRMLDDARPMHRLAGAWVADRTLPGHELREIKLWPALIARLRTLATTDPDPRLRARARLAIGRSGEAAAAVPSLMLVGGEP
ncbi:MAG TPA: hypothetical protein VF777_05965 [Phycisphaerales bacterium]